MNAGPPPVDTHDSTNVLPEDRSALAGGAMNQRLIIIGAGGFGREVMVYAEDCGTFNLKGFLDSRSHILDGFKLTGHFLERHIFEPRGLEMPEQRQRMLADLAQRTH